MYLMEDRKLLDNQGLNGQQKLLKLSLQTFIFCGFLRVLLFFTPSYILGVKKHTYFYRESDNQFDTKKELEAMIEKRECFFVYPWQRLFIE